MARTTIPSTSPGSLTAPYPIQLERGAPQTPTLVWQFRRSAGVTAATVRIAARLESDLPWVEVATSTAAVAVGSIPAYPQIAAFVTGITGSGDFLVEIEYAR